MNRINYFELATGDVEKAAAFYHAVFGWKIQKWNGPFDYWQVITGDESTPGSNGGLMQADGTFNGTINTVEVDDLDACIARVKANGGVIIREKHAIPGIGYQAYFKDNYGIVVGLHQTDPQAGLGS